MYLTFEAYAAMDGAITDKAAFNRYSYQAERKIDYLSFSRLRQFEIIPERVERLIFDLIPLFALLDKAEREENISAYSNDGVSVSLTVPTTAETENKIEELIFEALSQLTTAAGTPLLYCGVDDSE